MKERLSLYLENLFPGLLAAGYKVTSTKDKKYNCATWAVCGDSPGVWIEPRKGPGIEWPSTVPLDYSAEAYVQMCESFGFERCENGNLESDFEKIAIFADTVDEFSHAARQLADGRWTSKLGRDEDIEHDTLEAVVSNDYGTPVAYLKKRKHNAKK